MHARISVYAKTSRTLHLHRQVMNMYYRGAWFVMLFNSDKQHFMIHYPSCALPQALSSREQAHAGEGRVLSDVVCAPWGSLPGYGVPAFFGSFLRLYQV